MSAEDEKAGPPEIVFVTTRLVEAEQIRGLLEARGLLADAGLLGGGSGGKGFLTR
jgi:hypothetical protein